MHVKCGIVVMMMHAPARDALAVCADVMGSVSQGPTPAHLQRLPSAPGLGLSVDRDA